MYERAEVVREYAETGNRLVAAESSVLQRIGGSIAGAPILDLGVGTGRTTPAMLALSSDYLGVDYSVAMVDACLARFPGVRFRHFDARDLASLDSRRYRFIWFSWNGIDCLSDAERTSFLCQVFAKLEPGGFFFFSSHNQRSRTEKPWELGFYVYQWERKPLVFLRSTYRLTRNLLNYARFRGMQYETERHGLRVDSGHNFAVLHYYANPAAQVRHLAEIGFANVETMNGAGKVFAPDDQRLQMPPHIYFLAQRPME